MGTFTLYLNHRIVKESLQRRRTAERLAEISGGRVQRVKYLTCQIVFQLLFSTLQEVQLRHPLTW